MQTFFKTRLVGKPRFGEPLDRLPRALSALVTLPDVLVFGEVLNNGSPDRQTTEPLDSALTLLEINDSAP